MFFSLNIYCNISKTSWDVHSPKKQPVIIFDTNSDQGPWKLSEICIKFDSLTYRVVKGGGSQGEGFP